MRKIKCRIVKRTDKLGHIKYAIQQYRFFRWVDAPHYAVLYDNEFNSLISADANIYRFDGSKFKEEIIKIYK